ncbi:MAG: PAS domain-containing protein [Armatimonadetes bacterium]|nr:PAS domain-containing protein [Armatimonadota bacterium]
MFRSIQWRLTITFIILLACSMAVLGFFFLNSLEHFYQRNLEKRLVTNISALETRVIGYLEMGKPLDSVQAVSQCIGEEVRVGVSVFDEKGKLLGDSEGTRNPSEYMNLKEVLEALQGKTGRVVRTSPRTDTPFFYVAMPVKQDGRIKGVVRVAAPLTEVRGSLHQMRVMLLWGIALTLILALAACMKMAQAISSPIRELSRMAQGIVRGDWGGTIPFRSNDELGQLVQSFDEMRGKLRETIGEIRQEKSKMEAIISHLADGVILVDEGGKILLVNNGFADILNLDPDLLVGRRKEDLPADSQIRPLVEEMCRQQSFSSELQISDETDASEVKYLHVHGIALKGADGEKAGAVAVLHDLTRIYQSERMRQEFVANVSHELRTPVTTILVMAESLLGGAQEDPSVAEQFLKNIASESERLGKLIVDLLEISRFDSGEIRLEKTPFVIADLIRQTVQKLSPQAHQKGVAVQTDLLPSSIWVCADEERMNQVLINLLDNAIKYTQGGGKVSIACWELGGVVKIQISDTGVGIPQDDLPRIFERFYRVDKARSRAQGGTGLGLSIAKYFVEAHGGTIIVESKEGKGTAFTIALPHGESVVPSPTSSCMIRS